MQANQALREAAVAAFARYMRSPDLIERLEAQDSASLSLPERIALECADDAIRKIDWAVSSTIHRQAIYQLRAFSVSESGEMPSHSREVSTAASESNSEPQEDPYLDLSRVGDSDPLTDDLAHLKTLPVSQLTPEAVAFLEAEALADEAHRTMVSAARPEHKDDPYILHTPATKLAVEEFYIAERRLSVAWFTYLNSLKREDRERIRFPKTCPECGTVFFPTKRGQIYDKTLCADRAGHRRRREKKRVLSLVK